MDLEPHINKAAAEIKLDTGSERKRAVILTKKKAWCLSAPPSQELIPASYCLIPGSRPETHAIGVSVRMLHAPLGSCKLGTRHGFLSQIEKVNPIKLE